MSEDDDMVAVMLRREVAKRCNGRMTNEDLEEIEAACKLALRPRPPSQAMLKKLHQASKVMNPGRQYTMTNDREEWNLLNDYVCWHLIENGWEPDNGQ